MSFPLEYEQFESLAQAAFERWAPGSNVIYKPLKSGRSGAAVLKVDIRGKHSGEIENGLFILKLSARSKWADHLNESEAHQRAYDRKPDFSKNHIPSLVASFEAPKGEGYAILYEIAGASLDGYMAVDRPESAGFLSVCQALIRDTLRSWTNLEPDEDRRPSELLESWLGYRFNPAEANAFHAFVKDEIGDDLKFTQTGEVLINPLEFYKYCKTKQWQERGYLKALLHGDLHGGNILVNKFYPEQEPYWVIDFALSKDGPAGYDQAYLEVAQILYCLGERDPALLVGVLKQLDPGTAKALLPEGTFWLRNCLQAMRGSVFAWRDEAQARRIDDFNRQFCLARVAAGLNWANKPLTKNQRYLSLCYAGWAAREYLMNFESNDWASLWKDDSTPEVNSETETKSVDSALWEELWDITRGFSSRAGRYVLVAEAQDDSPNLRSIGQLPWSAVIDLDPYSDGSGLYRHAAPVLQGHRSLHTFSLSVPITEFDRGTAWMMAAGWVIKNEPPTDYTNWLYERLQLIRVFIKALEDAVNPTPVFVVVIPGKTLDPTMPMARLEKVVGAIDEVTRGKAKILLLGRTSLSEPIRVQHVPMDANSFLAQIQNTFGSASPINDAQIPASNKETGSTEWRSIPIDSLRTLQENLEILHSNILNETTIETIGAETNSFWRGRSPSWADFHSGNDIERVVNTKLIEVLREELETSRNRTVLLYHNPGAGGTTAAFRAAWDLHWEHPTAVLRHWSPALSDRLQQLFSIAQKPVLLVADSADLTEAAREDLYRDLSQRNTRVVILYIRRVLGSESEYPIALFDPMSRHEAESFYKTFAAQTEEPRRQQELRRITEDDELIRYRSPFFYGLVAFERDFLAVDKYVASHLTGIRGKARDVVEYIALLTIYSNTGLHEIILRRLLGLSGNVDLVLSDVIGEGPARLMTVRQERLRLMHQVIAEEVLSDLSSGGTQNWRRELDHLSIELIRDVTACTSPSSQIVLSMFRQLFTERLGGGVDGVEDRQDFAPIIEEIDSVDRSLGHQVLKKLTEYSPLEPHFWNHLGRHQIYRMRRDPEQAEQYVQEAIRLSPVDYIHFHTLGLVRRFRLRQILQGLRNQTAVEILALISTYFEGVIEAFEKTRALNPENIYGYITHVQIILEVADQLKRASGVENIGQLAKEDQVIIDWLEDQVAHAERLLSDAQQLYGTLDQERHSYITQCYANLQKLYGDLDRVIQIWELANVHGTNSAISRRALAHAYFARNGRRWDTMELSELTRVVELTEQNFRSSARRDEDYRFWFEAYKLLPEFDMEEAISKLHSWASHFPSWRAYYYLYVLHFYMWFSGKIDSIAEMLEALEKCQKYIIGRSHISHQWLGYEPLDCPLVSADSLGEWQKTIGFWENKSTLRAINGVIDDPIQGPQAGNILIDGKVRAFFVPSKGEFYRNKDENALVHFYLGFSPVGLRAWDVKRGHVEEGDRSRYGLPQPFNVPEAVHRPPVPDETKLSRVRSLKLSRVVDFVHDVVKAREAIGGELTISELERRLEAIFRVDGLIRELGFGSLEEMLEQTTEHRVRRVGSEILVGNDSVETSPRLPPIVRPTSLSQIVMFDQRRSFGFIEDPITDDRWFHRSYVLPGHQDKLKGKGQIVEFVPDVDEKGKPIAVGIRIYDDSFSLSKNDGLVSKPKLREAVTAVTLRILKDSLVDGEITSLSTLQNTLTQQFKGFGWLTSRLGVRRLEDFLREIEEVYIEGQYPKQYVRLKDERTFGRLPLSRAVSKDELANELREFVLKLLQKQRKGGELRVNIIEQRIKTAFGSRGNPLNRLGYRTLLAFLSDIPNLEVCGENPTDQFVRLIASSEKAESPPHRPSSDQTQPDAISLAISIVNQANGKQLKVAELSYRLNNVVRGPGSLANRLGHKTFSDFLRDVRQLEVYGTKPNQMVRLRRGSAGNAKILVVDILRSMRTRRDGFKLSYVGTKLSLLVPGHGNLAARLGYRSFIDFVREIPECEIYGDPGDPRVRLRQDHEFASTAPEQIQGAEPDLLGLAREILIEFLRDAAQRDKPVTLAAVSTRLHRELPGEGKVNYRLGFRTMRDFVQIIPDIELYESDRTDPLIRLKSSTQPIEISDAGEKSIDRIKNVVLSLAREAQASNRELSLPKVTAVLDAEVEGSGSLASRLGYGSFREFLADMSEIELYEKNGNQFLRLTSRKSRKRSSSRAESQRVNAEQKGSHLSAKDLVIDIVRQNAQAGRELTPLGLASILARRMPGEGTLTHRLGHRTFAEFLATIQEIKVERVDRKQYVRLTIDPEKASAT